MTADLQEALAWAVADSSGAINVSTVSATERAAKVNWLYIGALQFIPNTMSDEAIEALWQRASKGHGVHLVAVRILTRSPAEGEGVVVPREGLLADLLREVYEHPQVPWCCCGQPECLAARVRAVLTTAPQAEAKEES